MYGIDVADTDGSVNWATVKNSKRFAIVRATYGIREDLDSLFSHHWPIIKQYGMVRGAYHFFTISDPKDQAHRFLQKVGKLEPGDLPPVLDAESMLNEHGKETPIDRTAYIDRMKQWLAVVEQALKQQTGKQIKPIIYTGPDFWNHSLGDPRYFGDYPLWIADYTTESKPSVPLCWGEGNWLIHQFKGDTKVT